MVDISVCFGNLKRGSKLLQRKPKQLSKEHEGFIADALNGKVVIASGALYFAKGDVITTDYLIECKATQKSFYVLKRVIIEKIEKEALKCNRLPLLAIRILDRDFILFRLFDFKGKDHEYEIDLQESYKLSLALAEQSQLIVNVGKTKWQLYSLSDFEDLIGVD